MKNRQVVEHLLRDLDKSEIRLLTFLFNSRAVSRSKILTSFKAQVIEWMKSPEYVSPLSSRQWRILVMKFLKHRDYKDLLARVDSESK